jgi:hypothetical protein
MATTEPIHERSHHLGHYLTIVGIALALVLGAFVVDTVASTGLLTRTVGVEKGTFDVMAKYSPLKFVSPSPKGNPSR